MKKKPYLCSRKPKNVNIMSKRKTTSSGECIKFDRNNYRTHDENNKRMIRESLEACGAGRSVLVDNQNELIAGNGVFEQAQKMGIPTRIIETDGTELVVVKRTDLEPEDKRRKQLAAADNAIADRVTWNAPAIRADFTPVEIQALNIDLPPVELNETPPQVEAQEDAFEIERKKQEFNERMANGENMQNDEEYQEFLQKFELKKTTDDCYTPQLVYDTIADWVANEYGVNKKNFVRPFYPGGDYQNEKYKPTDIVVDNPPFSIMAEILRFYNKNNIRYFLFAPHLTLWSSSSSSSSSSVVVGVPITYENGAVINTSFLTNINGIEPRFKSCPSLYKAVNDANNENHRQQKRQLPKYSYDHHIITTSFLSALSRLGIEFECSRAESEAISQLDAQKESGKGIFGSGYIVSDRVFAEREKAEREKAEREKAEREKVEREKVERWDLSNREREIIERLNKAVK